MAGPAFEVVAYSPELEPWYAFVHREGYGGTAAAGRALRTFLIRDGALHVGFIDLAAAAGEQESLLVSAIGILPHYRRRGLGGLLVGAATRFGTESGFRRLHADVRALDPRVHQFFKRHGFSVGALAVEIESPGGARALVPPESVARESRDVQIRHLVYSYRRELA